MALKVVRRRKWSRYDDTGNEILAAGTETDDDGSWFDTGRYELVVRDGDNDPSSDYQAAYELTEAVYDGDGNPVHQPGEQFTDLSSVDGSVRWKYVVLAADATPATWS